MKAEQETIKELRETLLTFRRKIKTLEKDLRDVTRDRDRLLKVIAFLEAVDEKY